MIRYFLAGLVGWFAVSVAHAQNFNVDALGGHLPSASFGAAANQSGVWQVLPNLGPGSSVALFDVTGAATTARLGPIANSGNATGFVNDPGTSGDDEALMDEIITFSGFSPMQHAFTGLLPGTYDVFTYAWRPNVPSARTLVSASNSLLPASTSTSVGGAWPSTYVVGVTHALDTVAVGADGVLFVNLGLDASGATLNGFQLRRTLALTIPSFCEGAAVGTTCTACGNNGAVGRGCANSVFPNGGRLMWHGTPRAVDFNDTFVLRADGITGPGVFFQSNTLAATPIVFGDGMLCANGGVRRLGVASPSSGIATYPGAGAPAIHTAGLVSPGDVRHYQLWYRDAGAFCTTATFNLTNGRTVTWLP